MSYTSRLLLNSTYLRTRQMTFLQSSLLPISLPREVRTISFGKMERGPPSFAPIPPKAGAEKDLPIRNLSCRVSIVKFEHQKCFTQAALVRCSLTCVDLTHFTGHPLRNSRFPSNKFKLKNCSRSGGWSRGCRRSRGRCGASRAGWTWSGWWNRPRGMCGANGC